MKRLNKRQMINYLMATAKFRHNPCCDYDTTEEFQFSREDCIESLNIIPKKWLRTHLKNGIVFVSDENIYSGSRTEKYLDLDIRDAKTYELIGTPITTYSHETARRIRKWWMGASTHD